MQLNPVLLIFRVESLSYGHVNMQRIRNMHVTTSCVMSVKKVKKVNREGAGVKEAPWLLLQLVSMMCLV